MLNNYIPLLLMRISGSSFNRRHKIFLELSLLYLRWAGYVCNDSIHWQSYIPGVLSLHLSLQMGKGVSVTINSVGQAADSYMKTAGVSS